MENIYNSYLDLWKLEHGTFKFNFVYEKIYFDSLFVKSFDLPHSFRNGVALEDKTVQSNRELQNLISLVRKVKSNKTFVRSEYEYKGETKYIYIKRLIQLDQDYIYAYFFAPKLDDFAPGYEVNKGVLELIGEMFNTTYWYVDISSGKNMYFSSSPFYGSNGELIPSEKSIYYSLLDKAVHRNGEYKTLVDVVKRNVKDMEKGLLDSYSVKYPMCINNEIVWVETNCKVVVKNSKGVPTLIVGVDSILSGKELLDVETETLDQIMDVGLKNADIGLWVMTERNGVKSFKYNSKLTELYSFDKHVSTVSTDSKEYDDIFLAARDRVLNKYPEYKHFFDKDYELFNKTLEGEIDRYRSFLPVLRSNNEVIWLEIRGSVSSKREEGTVSTMMGVAIDVTENFDVGAYSMKHQNAQTAFERANKSAIDMMEILIWSIDYKKFPEGDFFYGNEQYIEKLGLEKNEEGLIHIFDYFDSILPADEYSVSLEDVDDFTKRLKENEIDGFEGLIVRHKNKKTGEILYGEHSSRVAERDKNGKITLLSGFFIDVTNEINERRMRKKLESDVDEVRKFNRLAIQAGQLMVFNINYLKENKGHEIYANNIFIEKLGIETKDNHYSYETYVSTISDDEEGKKLFKTCDATYLDVLKGNRHGVTNMLSKHKNLKTGEIFYMQHNSHVEERSSDGTVIAIGGYLRDVTQDVMNKKKVKYLAEMDSLTDVYNRNKFEEIVSSLDLNQYTVVLFDIDGLKLANDIYGHQVGDEVLIRFTQMVKDAFDTEYIFRIGGDEFCVLDSENENLTYKKIEQVEKAMEKMVIQDSVRAGVSVGYETVGNQNFEQAFMFAENQMYRKKLSSRSSRKSQTLDTLMITLSEKTEETKEHCDRIEYLAKQTYKQLGYARSGELYDIGLSARLHDIGKITVPLEMLNKSGKLTEEEYKTVKKHSEAGYKIVFNIINSNDIAEGVLYHHERYDGKGYPYGLAGKEIPIYARIISVCDSYDAMISDRPYSKAKKKEEAISELKRCSGSQFDPEVVEAFIAVILDEYF